MNLRVNKVNYT